MYFHLIGYAEKNLTATELKQILEEPMQTGETLFSAASYNSLPIASDLINRNIEINFINDLFMTPQARFYIRLSYKKFRNFNFQPFKP